MTSDRPALYEMFDDRFRTGRCMNGDAGVEVLYTGCRWAEGPVYVPAFRQVIWSDIPNDRMLRWDEETGAVGVFRRSAGYTNGNTLDGQGRLITCEQGNRRVTRTEHDGTVTVLADRWQGKRLNSPNDAAVKSDGSLWFSDPDFGITSDYEGHRAESEIGANNVYRVDPDTGEVRLVADGLTAPNGLMFSADERRLFVSDTGANHIRVFGVRDDGTLTTARSSPTPGTAGTPASTTSASTTAGGSGRPRWTTGCTATTPTARSSDGSSSRRRSPTSPGAAPSATVSTRR
ncbi:hypothetical protein GCM10018785_01410 [Streptomyces longispororuber]|uniref:SMP-30/Gluconolactonase/LRE-like region domain-containing protein n=1 Tax=Streptomyces longispororuber TaxID=68230 RepID=A0A918Z326_9ACTN|nr:hypothetical protein GCM10018785_01410 [Streptomyces longispororuber]